MVTLGPWSKGMNNRAADHALPISTRENPGNACRNAVNVNFDNQGKGKRRDGMTKVLSLLNGKNSFSCEIGCYFIDGMDLKKFNPADNTGTVIYTGVTGTEYAFDYYNGTVYFSDGVVSLKITATSVSKWGMTAPAAPVLSATAGSYGAGVYLATCCFVDAQGVESGNSPIVSISVPDNSGFVFNYLPTITDPQVVAVRLYMSTANGKEFYHVADTTAGTYTITSGRYDEGSVFDNHFISPPPPARAICHYNGRSYVADAYGNVFYSKEFSFDQFDLRDNLQFPKVVDIMLPVAGGIFFAYGNQTDFYGGNPEAGFNITAKFNYGGVFGTGKKIPNSDDACWQSQRGMVIGTADGQCKNIVEENVATDSAVSGATLIREQNGLRQFIASLQQPTISKLAATSWMEAEIIRRGA